MGKFVATHSSSETSMITVPADHGYLIGRPRHLTMKPVLIRQVARPARLREWASSLWVHGVLYNDVDRQRMIDYVGAVVRVMLVRLDATACIFGTG